jgi:hypothetical protein
VLYVKRAEEWESCKQSLQDCSRYATDGTPLVSWTIHHCMSMHVQLSIGSHTYFIVTFEKPLNWSDSVKKQTTSPKACEILAGVVACAALFHLARQEPQPVLLLSFEIFTRMRSSRVAMQLNKLVENCGSR